MHGLLAQNLNYLRTLFFFYLLLLGTVLGSAYAQSELATSDFYETAILHFQNKEYRKAFIELKNGLRKNPKDLPARILLGQVHLELGDGASAEKELVNAIKLGADKSLALPLLAKALLQQTKYKEVINDLAVVGISIEAKSSVLTSKGEAYIALKRFLEAKRVLNEATQLMPDKAAPLLATARLYLAKKKKSLALDNVDLAVRIEPDNPSVWFLKGEIAYAAKNWDGALSSYKRTVELDPGHIDARIGRAAALIEIRQENVAIADVDKVLDEIPNHTAALYLKVLILARVKDRDGGKEIIKQASNALTMINPALFETHPPTVLLAGVIRFAENNFDEAEIHLTHYIQFDPKSVFARKLLGKILLNKGDFEVASAVLKPAVDIKPNDAQLLAMLGIAYLNRGKHDQATALFENAVKLTPDEPGLLTNLAISRFAAGQEEKAFEELKNAMAKNSKEIKTGAILAYLHLKQGKFDEAIEITDRMLAIEPENPLLLNLAGVGYLGKKEYALAKIRFDKALEKNPAFAPALMNLAQIDWLEGNFDFAKARLKKILATDPKNVDVMVRLSRVAEARDRLDEAISWLEKIDSFNEKAVIPQAHLVDLYLKITKPDIALATAERLNYRDPTNFAIIMKLGEAQMAMDQHSKAVETFKTAAVLSAKSADRLYQVARKQLSAKDYDGARETLIQGVQLSPGHVPLVSALVYLDINENRLDEALSRANMLQLDNSNSIAGYILAGDVQLRMKRPEVALMAYKKAEKKNDSAMVAARIFQADKEIRGIKKALKTLEDWTRTRPADVIGKQTLAHAYVEAGQLTKAREFHEKLLENYPNNSQLLNGLAWIYQQQGDPRALSYAEKAYKLSPNEASVLDTLGWVLIQKGEPAKALKHLREAYTRASRQPLVSYHIGVALHKLGRNDEARTHLKKALALNNEFDGADHAKSILAKF